MRRTTLCAILLLTATTFSFPVFAEDIQSGTWGGGKANEGAVSTTELKGILKPAGLFSMYDQPRSVQLPIFQGVFACRGVLRSDGTYGDNIEQIVNTYPDKATPIILYCNGPLCGKSKRTAQPLAEQGYTNIRRYNLSPVWRAFGNTVQTDLSGLVYILKGDQTAVFVDVRSPELFKADTIPNAVNIQKDEVKAANEDGRLPHKDKGTRVVIFGASGESARQVAEEVAKTAYWNSSYFGGTYEDIRGAHLW